MKSRTYCAILMSLVLSSTVAADGTSLNTEVGLINTSFFCYYNGHISKAQHKEFKAGKLKNLVLAPGNHCKQIKEVLKNGTN